ncbi:MAG: hypothetical protein J6F31_01265 [Oscillospiraceae bacterium]|nr:hypothetical protein [Oscillospiraceae bacterium]
MALFGFGKKKEEPLPKVSPVSSVSNVDPDEFFKNMGRKPKTPKGVAEISVPEVAGHLREEPLPRPKSTIKSFAQEINTDGLVDKSALAPAEDRGDIRLIDTTRLNTDVIPKEEKIYREPKELSADDFFKDLDRKRPAKIDIDVPEVTGLREGPAPQYKTEIGDAFADTKAAEALKDKTTAPLGFVTGDINTIDVTKLDMSVLRD